jgi:hypothetical protein
MMNANLVSAIHIYGRGFMNNSEESGASDVCCSVVYGSWHGQGIR